MPTLSPSLSLDSRRAHLGYAALLAQQLDPECPLSEDLRRANIVRLLPVAENIFQTVQEAIDLYESMPADSFWRDIGTPEFLATHETIRVLLGKARLQLRDSSTGGE